MAHIQPGRWTCERLQVQLNCSCVAGRQITSRNKAGSIGGHYPAADTLENMEQETSTHDAGRRQLRETPSFAKMLTGGPPKDADVMIIEEGASTGKTAGGRKRTRSQADADGDGSSITIPCHQVVLYSLSSFFQNKVRVRWYSAEYSAVMLSSHSSAVSTCQQAPVEAANRPPNCRQIRQKQQQQQWWCVNVKQWPARGLLC